MMRRQRLFILLIGVCLLANCQKKHTTEPPGNNSHPQVDIPWPSLADSPWPMHHGNPQSTGRSRTVGPQQGAVAWDFKVGKEVGTSVAIGPDSTIYFGSDGPYLWALNWDGTLKWKLYLFDNLSQPTQASSPLVAADGTIYIGTRGKMLYAVNPDGTIKWKFEADSWLNNLGMNIGLDGTIYFVDHDFWLYAVNPDGSLKWKTGGDYLYQGIEMSGIAISPDGSTLYLGCLGTVESDSIDGLLAVGTDGSVKWLFRSCPAYGTPLIDNAGNIFYCTQNRSDSNGDLEGMISLTPEGELRWYYTAKMDAMIDPTMDYDGNVYFVAAGQPEQFALVSMTNDGIIRWEYTAFRSAISSLVCDKNFTIYVANYSSFLFSFTSAGNLNWKMAIGEIKWDCPAIAWNRILFGTGYRDENGKFYSIK